MLFMNNYRLFVSIRQGAVTVLEKQFQDIPHDQRVEFIPVEWRSSLKLDEGNKSAALHIKLWMLTYIKSYFCGEKTTWRGVEELSRSVSN